MDQERNSIDYEDFSGGNLSYRYEHQKPIANRELQALTKRMWEIFFANLRTVYERHQLGPEAIYYIDETGLTTA